MVHKIHNLEFTLSLVLNPLDLPLNLAVYSDYLEDQGDPDCEWIREWLDFQNYGIREICSMPVYATLPKCYRIDINGNDIILIKYLKYLGLHYDYLTFDLPQDRIPQCEDKREIFVLGSIKKYETIPCVNKARLWEYNKWYCDECKIPF